jgi:hypothetical protein
MRCRRHSLPWNGIVSMREHSGEEKNTIFIVLQHFEVANDLLLQALV